MTSRLQALQRRIVRTSVNRRGRRQYDEELRQEIASYVGERRAQGESYAYIARTLGVPDATLLYWRKKRPVRPKQSKRAVGFRPVAMQEQELDVGSALSKDRSHSDQVVHGPVMVLPSGIRIEGIAVTELPELVRNLICLP